MPRRSSTSKRAENLFRADVVFDLRAVTSARILMGMKTTRNQLEMLKAKFDAHFAKVGLDVTVYVQPNRVRLLSNDEMQLDLAAGIAFPAAQKVTQSVRLSDVYPGRRVRFEREITLA